MNYSNPDSKMFEADNKMFYDPELFERDVGIKTPGNEFYIKKCREIGGPILELGCGTGKILIPVATYGIDVCGLDISEDMIEYFKKKIIALEKSIQEKITLRHSNMSNFSFDGKFKLIIVPAHGFCHLKNSDEIISCIMNIKEHLDEDGYLIFDIPLFNISYLSQFITNPLYFHYIDDSETNNNKKLKVFEKTSYDTISQNLTAEFRYELVKENDHVEDIWYRTLHQRMITIEEMKLYLKLSNLKLLSIFGGYNEDLPLKPEAVREVVFITKIGD